jgi:hypothetical protein
MEINLNGHPEKIVKDLRAAADNIVADRHAMIEFTDDEGNENEITFTPDSGGFGLEDKLYADEIE